MRILNPQTLLQWMLKSSLPSATTSQIRFRSILPSRISKRPRAPGGSRQSLSQKNHHCRGAFHKDCRISFLVVKLTPHASQSAPDRKIPSPSSIRETPVAMATSFVSIKFWVSFPLTAASCFSFSLQECTQWPLAGFYSLSSYLRKHGE